MKKNIYSIVVLSSIILLTINIFIKSQYLTSIIVFSVNLFIKNIFPSLFPMFVISGILVEIGIPKFLGSIFNKSFRFLFKTSGSASFVFFMGLITGFPSSAKYIEDLINKKVINEKEAQQILNFTFFSNPLFIINTVGNVFLHSKIIGVFIFISHIFGNIITGIIFSFFYRGNNHNEIVFSGKDLINEINDANIIQIVLNSIKNAIQTLINIFGIVTFFLIIINIVFFKARTYITILITGIFEMTTGLKYLSFFDCSSLVKILTSTFFISFGGLSVHTQIMDILKEKKVKYLPFIIARILHSIISVLIMYLFYLLLSSTSSFV